MNLSSAPNWWTSRGSTSKSDPSTQSMHPGREQTRHSSESSNDRMREAGAKLRRQNSEHLQHQNTNQGHNFNKSSNSAVTLKGNEGTQQKPHTQNEWLIVDLGSPLPGQICGAFLTPGLCIHLMHLSQWKSHFQAGFHKKINVGHTGPPILNQIKPTLF